MQAQRSQSLSDLNMYLVIGSHVALFVGFSLATPLIKPEVPLALKIWGTFLATGIATWSVVLVAGLAGKLALELGLTSAPAQVQLQDADTAVPAPGATHAAIVLAEKRRADLAASAA